MNDVINIEERESAAVAWQKGPQHRFYEDRYRLLCRPIPLILAAKRGEIYAVFDGVGSAPKGMAAAQAVCDSLTDFFDQKLTINASHDSLLSLLKTANDRISNWGMIDGTDRSEGACAGTIVWIDNSLVAHIFHIGDTTALLIRNGQCMALTSVHHTNEGHLNNYFGQFSPTFEERIIQLELGDRLALFTDGVGKAFYLNQQIADILENHADRKASLRALLNMVRRSGSSDDATAIVVDVE